MSVVFVPVQMDVPKEGKEVVDLLASIAADIKAGKSVAEIAASNLPKLIVAFDGYNKLPEEFRSAGNDELMAYLVREMGAVLKPAPAPVA